MTLPRMHAVTDADVLAHPGFLAKARRIATLGARVVIHLRDRTATGRALSNHALALRDALDGTGTPLIVNARPDIAAGISAEGTQLGVGDLDVADARRVLSSGWIGRSVHNVDEARSAVKDRADFLLAGTAYPTASHPGVAPKGMEFIGALAELGAPVIAIGGITPRRAGEVHAAGAWGVAAIRSIWEASDPAQAAEQMLAPWGDS